MRNLPHNSVFRVENNLFVLTKQPGDQRVLGFWGADIRNTMTLGDGSAAKVYLYIDHYVDAIAEAAHVWAVPVIDIYSLSGLLPTMPSQRQYFCDEKNDHQGTIILPFLMISQ